MPSGACGNSANTARSERSPLAPMANVVSLRPALSATMSVAPSGVIAMPFATIRSSAATDAVPSGSTRINGLGAGVAPAWRS